MMGGHMIPDDEVLKLWEKTHPETERGRSDVSLFDFVQEIWDRAYEQGRTDEFLNNGVAEY